MSGVHAQTLIGTAAGPIPAGEFSGGQVFAWKDGAGVSMPMSAVVVANSDEMWVVETWFGGGCRDCNHHTNKGMMFYVGPGQEFLLKSGDFWKVEDLVPGIRLRVIGRDCGFEEVRSVSRIVLDEAKPLYSLRVPFSQNGTVDNYGLGDDTLPNKVLVKSY